MKNSIFLKSALIGTLAILFSIQAGSADKPLPNIGQIVWVKGLVKAIGPNKVTRDLQRRSPIYTEDTIITDKTSTGEIVFSDNSLVALREDTEFRIDKYQFGKNVPPQKSEYVASLVKGGFRTITGIIPKNNPDNYQVKTPVATIAVQGTGYSVFFKNGQLSAKYYSGRPCVSNSKGSVCLDQNNPFSTATSTTAPVRTSTVPEAFQQDLELTPASFSPASAPTGPPGATKTGTVGSFCIT